MVSSGDTDVILFHKMFVYSILCQKDDFVSSNGKVLHLNVFQQGYSAVFLGFLLIPHSFYI